MLMGEEELFDYILLSFYLKEDIEAENKNYIAHNIRDIWQDAEEQKKSTRRRGHTDQVTDTWQPVGLSAVGGCLPD